MDNNTEEILNDSTKNSLTENLTESDNKTGINTLNHIIEGYTYEVDSDNPFYNMWDD